MASRIQISAKRLGEVALPNFCPRCFWIKLKMGNRLPYQVFPGIFSSIDSYSKRVVHSWFDNHKVPPVWLGGLGEIVDYLPPPHHSKFRIVDQNTDILLTGSPDGVFLRSDRSHLIVDYKTSRHTPHQDRLYPMYATQLNAYARIGEECGLNPVSALALVYTEPITDDEAAAKDINHHPDGFLMGFQAKVFDVPVDPTLLDPLLAKTREIHELATSPAERRGCKDCRQLEDLIGFANG